MNNGATLIYFYFNILELNYNSKNYLSLTIMTRAFSVGCRNKDGKVEFQIIVSKRQFTPRRVAGRTF